MATTEAYVQLFEREMGKCSEGLLRRERKRQREIIVSEQASDFGQNMNKTDKNRQRKS